MASRKGAEAGRSQQNGAMQLFFDIDGVLLNFERSFVAWLNREHGMSLPEDYQALSWDFTEVMDKRAMDQSWFRFVESPAAGEMAPLIDPALFNALGDGHGVHLVTNFPQPHMEKRLENLKALGFRYDSLHYCGIHPFRDHQPRTKAQVIKSLLAGETGGRPSLFVDDHPGNCLDVHENCPEIEVWLMSRRFNRDFAHPNIRRAHGWDCLLERLVHPPDPSNGNPDGETFP